MKNQHNTYKGTTALFTALALALMMATATPAAAQCSRYNDSLALVDLYNNTGGSNWSYNAFGNAPTYVNGILTNQPIPNLGVAWNFSQPINTWHGVRLHPNGCVKDLILTDINSGTLTNLNLPDLEVLFFSNLSINPTPGVTGNLSNFTGLTNLKYLRIGFAGINGSIPNFTNFPNLQHLYLIGNQLSGSIPNFSNLPSLEILNLSTNQLSGNIPNFTNLPNLQKLSLGGNQLSGTIPNFTSLPNLNFLELSENNLDSCGVLPLFPYYNLLRTYGNNLTFDDILPNVISWYDPQDSAGVAQTVFATVGTTAVLPLGFDEGVTTSTYTWYKNGTLLSNNTTTSKRIINNVGFSAAGSYTANVTNSVATALTLNARPITLKVCPKVGIINDVVACPGTTSVTLNANTGGVNTGASYSWSTGATNSSINVSTSGNYIVTISSSSCTVKDTISVVFSNLAATANQTPVLCNGGTNGSVTATPSGGTSGYTYLWNTGQTTASINNLSAGTYTVTITDANNCTTTASTTITQPNPISLSEMIVNDNGTGNGAIAVTVSGGVAPYSYQWSNGGTSSMISQLSHGTYIVVVSDANNCTFTASFVVELDTKTNEIQNDKITAILVYPNPSAKNVPVTLQIEGEAIGEVHYEIADYSGKSFGTTTIFHNATTTQHQIQLPQAAGLYIVVLKQNGQRIKSIPVLVQ